MKFFLVAGALVLACLWACTSSPQQLEPDLGMTPPEQWISPYPATTGSMSNWWTDFGDTRLNEFIQHALERNSDVRAALARIDAATAQARITGADLDPTLDGNLSVSRRRQNFTGFPFSQGPDEIVATTTNTFGASLNLSWEIDLWGRLRSAHAASLAQVEVSRAELEGIRLSLAAQTAKAWFACIEASQQLTLAQATVENFSQTRDQIRSRYERGLRSSLDLRLAESNVSSAQAILYSREDQLQRIIRQLEILVGRYPSGRLEIGDGFPGIITPVPAGIPADIISRRPDLVSAERRLAASIERVSQAKASLYPRIALTASGGRSSDELENLLDGDYTIWSLAGNLLQPIFQGGRLRAGVDLARARKDETAAQFVGSVLAAYSEVEIALAAEAILSHRQDALIITVEQAMAARNLAQERYMAGLVDYVSLLEAQRGAFEARSQLLSVRRQRVDARIDLYLALGGGFTREDIGDQKQGGGMP
ncbi:MAG: efflux transporter outer membrane subunit [Desulfomonilia bacterium]